MADKHRVMVIDDEEDLRTIVGMMLDTTYEVVFAHDGLDAIQKIALYEPDLVLLDVVMPVMNGFDTCVAIRRLPAFHDLPVIFLSAVTRSSSVQKMKELGGDAFVPKPIDPGALLERLGQFLTRPPRAKQMSLEQIQAHEASAAAGADAERGAAEPPPRLDKALRPRLLIVDDDPELRTVLSAAFGGDFETVTARDGREALGMMSDIEPDLVILDIAMPRLNGLQVCESMRRAPRFAQIPVLFQSAHQMDSIQREIDRLGNTRYLRKPCPIDHIRRALDEMMALPSFRVWPKRRSLAELTDPARQEEFRERARRAFQSVEREFGALREACGHEPPTGGEL